MLSIPAGCWLIFAREVAGPSLTLFILLLFFFSHSAHATNPTGGKGEKEEGFHGHQAKIPRCRSRAPPAACLLLKPLQQACSPSASGKDGLEGGKKSSSSIPVLPWRAVAAPCLPSHAQPRMPMDLGHPLRAGWAPSPPPRHPQHPRAAVGEEDVEQSRLCAANINYPLTALQAAIRSRLSDSCSRPYARGTRWWGAAGGTAGTRGGRGEGSPCCALPPRVGIWARGARHWFFPCKLVLFWGGSSFQRGCGVRASPLHHPAWLLLRPGGGRGRSWRNPAFFF